MSNQTPDAPPLYTGYDVLTKWPTLSFDDVTRGVLSERMAAPAPPRFFAPEAFATLEAACARLLATPRGTPPLANWIDADLFEDRREGYRAANLPPVTECWRKGIEGLQREARARWQHAFSELPGNRQDEVLRAMQNGEADAAHFGGIDARHFFTHILLKSAAGHFYGQPAAWSEIGFGGPASPRGYVRMRLDERDPWEAPLTGGRR